MKNFNRLVTALFCLPLLCARCSYSLYTDGSKYQTPELFLSQANELNASLSSSEVEHSSMVYDVGLEVKEAILQCAEFIEAKSFQPSVTRRFVYRILESHSTAGPNYAEMTIAADGSLQIEAKSALSYPTYYFYTIDPEEADVLNSIVEDKIRAANEATSSRS